MAVNESIWGASNTWVDVLNNMCKTTSTTMYGLLDDTLVLNELVDNTVCYFGAVQDENTWYKAEQIIFESTTDAYPLYETEDITNCLFLLNNTYQYGYGNPGQIAFWLQASFHDQWSKYETKASISTSFLNTSIKPLFNIKLNKILWQPHVFAFDDADINTSSSGHSVSCTLQEWISTRHTQYPYLSQLTMYPYYNNGTDENPNWIPMYDTYDDIYYWAINKKLSERVQDYGDKTIDILYAERATNSKLTELVMGLYASNYSSMNGGFIFASDPDTTHYIHDSTWIRYCREYSEDLIDEIRTQIAFYGVFFIGDAYTGTLNDLTLTHESVYCGIIDENGYTHGDYSNGTDNEDRQQFEWEDSSESNYDPDVPPTPPNNWSNEFPSKYSVYAKYLANHWYLFDDADLYKFFAEVNNVDLSTLDKNATYGLNPIDGVLQVKRIFANFTTAKTHLMTSASQYTKIGSLQLDIGSQVANVATFNETYTKDCGTKYAGEIYPDFRSYAPFSSICFYDAFCGVIELQPEKVLNKYITVEQTIDLLLGDKITSVYASPDGSVNKRVRIATLHGNCAEDIPINGQAVADYQRNKYILTQQKTQQEYTTAGRFAMGVGGATISAVEGNFVGAIAQVIGAGENLGAGITGIKTTEQLLEHTVPSIVRVSQGSSNVEDGVIFPPMLIIFPPKMIESYNESEYADKSGFSGYKIDTIANCGVGTHIVSHPRIEISGTSSEVYTIVDQLQKGIYVKPIE